MTGIVLLVSAGASGLPVWVTPVGACAYAFFIVFVGRRWLRKLSTHELEENFPQARFALILLVVLVSALITEILGLHPMFGAFLIGVVMPKDSLFVMKMKDKLEDMAVVLLLPLYFVYPASHERSID